MSDSRERSRGHGSAPSQLGQRNVIAQDSRSSLRSTVLIDDDLLGGDLAFLDRPEWRLACRVVASKGLAKSDLLQRFLLYVCEQQLKGRASDITEQRIGTQIFNRPSDYNPGEDNIVRSYARMLRKRLDEYFDGEGHDEPMRIVIPRGGYIPSFVTTSETPLEIQQPLSPSELSPELSELPEQLPLPPTAQDTPIPAAPSKRFFLFGLLVGLLIAAAAWFALRYTQTPKNTSPAHPIWAQLFQKNRNLLIVPADSGLGILQNLTSRLATLEDYSNGTYLSELKPPEGLSLNNLNDLRHQRYTSVVDLNITAMLTQLPEFVGSRSQIRYARNITTEDLKNSNAILIGSMHTNPWVALFDDSLNFKLHYMPEVDQSFVLNAHPIGNEQPKYLNSTGSQANRTYGTIDYLPSLDSTGHVLIIQGLNMAATQAAADILSNKDEMSPILRQATRPDGSLRSFELLLETTSIGANAPSARIIATRFGSR